MKYFLYSLACFFGLLAAGPFFNSLVRGLAITSQQAGFALIMGAASTLTFILVWLNSHHQGE